MAASALLPRIRVPLDNDEVGGGIPSPLATPALLSPTYVAEHIGHARSIALAMEAKAAVAAGEQPAMAIAGHGGKAHDIIQAFEVQLHHEPGSAYVEGGHVIHHHRHHREDAAPLYSPSGAVSAELLVQSEPSSAARERRPPIAQASPRPSPSLLGAARSTSRAPVAIAASQPKIDQEDAHYGGRLFVAASMYKQGFSEVRRRGDTRTVTPMASGPDRDERAHYGSHLRPLFGSFAIKPGQLQTVTRGGRQNAQHRAHAMPRHLSTEEDLEYQYQQQGLQPAHDVYGTPTLHEAGEDEVEEEPHDEVDGARHAPQQHTFSPETRKPVMSGFPGMAGNAEGSSDDDDDEDEGVAAGGADASSGLTQAQMQLLLKTMQSPQRLAAPVAGTPGPATSQPATPSLGAAMTSPAARVRRIPAAQQGSVVSPEPSSPYSTASPMVSEPTPELQPRGSWGADPAPGSAGSAGSRESPSPSKRPNRTPPPAPPVHATPAAAAVGRSFSVNRAVSFYSPSAARGSPLAGRASSRPAPVSSLSGSVGLASNDDLRSAGGGGGGFLMQRVEEEDGDVAIEGAIAVASPPQAPPHRGQQQQRGAVFTPPGGARGAGLSPSVPVGGSPGGEGSLGPLGADATERPHYLMDGISPNRSFRLPPGGVAAILQRPSDPSQPRTPTSYAEIARALQQEEEQAASARGGSADYRSPLSARASSAASLRLLMKTAQAEASGRAGWGADDSDDDSDFDDAEVLGGVPVTESQLQLFTRTLLPTSSLEAMLHAQDTLGELQTLRSALLARRAMRERHRLTRKSSRGSMAGDAQHGASGDSDGSDGDEDGHVDEATRARRAALLALTSPTAAPCPLSSTFSSPFAPVRGALPVADLAMDEYAQAVIRARTAGPALGSAKLNRSSSGKRVTISEPSDSGMSPKPRTPVRTSASLASPLAGRQASSTGGGEAEDDEAIGVGQVLALLNGKKKVPQAKRTGVALESQMLSLLEAKLKELGGGSAGAADDDEDL